MQKIFKKYKGFNIIHESYSGILCGYNETKFLVATEQKPDCSFRLTDKDTFMLEEYKDKKYRYFYCDERELVKQYKSGRKRPQ